MSEHPNNSQITFAKIVSGNAGNSPSPPHMDDQANKEHLTNNMDNEQKLESSEDWPLLVHQHQEENDNGNKVQKLGVKDRPETVADEANKVILQIYQNIDYYTIY